MGTAVCCTSQEAQQQQLTIEVNSSKPLNTISSINDPQDNLNRQNVLNSDINDNEIYVTNKVLEDNNVYTGQMKKLYNDNGLGLSSQITSHRSHRKTTIKPSDHLQLMKTPVKRQESILLEKNFKLVKHGTGFLRYSDTKFYEGEFYLDQKHGSGEDNYDGQGTRYVGEFFKDTREGVGQMEWSDGSKYVGDWVGNMHHGHGQIIYKSGKSYIGDFQNNLMHGKGKITWPDGKYYEGQFANGDKNGYGVHRWNDGQMFEGEWQNGLQHGKGTIIKNNERRMGNWKAGKREYWISELQKVQDFGQ